MSSRGANRPATAPFFRFAVRVLSASATATSTLVGNDGADGDNVGSVTATTCVVSIRASAGACSGKFSACFSPTTAALGAATECCVGLGKGICAGWRDSSGGAIRRSAIACSMRCRTRSAKPRPIRRSPPTAATTPGVTIVGSKVRSWMDTPEAASNIPAALNKPPITNKSKYIRLSLTLNSRAKNPLQGSIVTAPSEPRKDFFPMRPEQFRGLGETNSPSVMRSTVAQPPAKVLFRGTIRFP